MSAFFNIGSLTLGLTAWAIAYIALCKRSRHPLLPLSSFACCCASLLLQFCEINHRTDIGDYAAIEDTIESTIYAGVILVAVTLLLNLAALIRAMKK